MSETVIDQKSASALAGELRRSFSGEVLVGGQPGYNDARTIWNAMVDKKPTVIAGCVTTDDVVASVKLARHHGLQVSVRCGGHGVTGKALADGGLTIDLTRMRGVRVSPDNRTASVQGGCLLGDVDAATAQHGMIVPAGIVSETGVGGLALGGGILLGMRVPAIRGQVNRLGAYTAGVAALLVFLQASGLWGVLVTDLFQFVLKMSMVVLLAVLAVNAVGGIDALKTKIAALDAASGQTGSRLVFFPDLDSAWMPAITFFVYLGVNWWATWYPGAEPGGGGYVAQRIFSAKDERHGLLF